MVWNEVEDKLKPPLGEFYPGDSKAFPASQMFVHHIASHTIRRPHVIF